MRFIPIEKVENGMMLAKTIYDYGTGTLLREGKLLNEEIIMRIRDRGYPGIYIEDELTKDIVIKEAITVELRNHAVETLQDLDLEEAVHVAENIVEQLMEAKTVSLDMLDLRTFDNYTYRHSVNVAILSVVIGMGMGYTNEELVDLCAAAIFHDLGKLAIDKEILNKPGKLTPEENELLRSHPQISYDMLKEKWNIPSRVKAAVLSHHENEDGSGYPNGLFGDAIHPFAKIIHVADVYDALSSDRAYKKAYSYAESLEYLMGGCGTLFDQKVVQTFIDRVPIYPKGVSVLMSDGREGIVVENHLGSPLRPTVRFLDGSELDMRNTSIGRNLTIINQTNVQIINEEEMVHIETERKSRELKNILVVDDMVSSIRAVKSALDGLYKVIAVRSGEEALQYLKKGTPNLILMDILMPNMNGIETVKLIREQFPGNVPVIFLSSANDVQTVLACRDVHADDYIVKPFKVDYIRKRIAMILGER
ncbi:MAG: HD domain-containing phosphohydrolase [Lachnospiraceae bacterium]